MIVVDVNVVAYLLIEGPASSEAQRVREKDDVWRLPPLWRYEFTNILALYVRHREMSERESIAILERAVELFEPAENQVEARLALQLALKHNISGYDAQYLALAEQLGVSCISEDKQLCAAVPARIHLMREFLA